jgi:type I restriction enzyme S subunit
MTIYSLPVGWRLRKIGEVAKLIGGGTPSRKRPDYFEGHIPWITGYDLSETEPILQSARECITQEAIENSATNLIPKGQVLLTTRVTVGKVAIAGFDVCISQDIQGVICSEEVLSEYMYYFLLSKKERMVALQRGTTIKGIPKRVVQSLEIPLPPLPIQRRIVDILERADDLRRKRAQAYELAKHIPTALFIKMFGDPTTNPMEWPVAKLDEVANIIMGQSPPSSTYNTEGAGLPFFQGKAEFGEIYPTVERWCSKPKKVAEKGDILLSVRAPVGPVNLAPSKCCIGRGLAAMRGYEHRLAQKWLLLNMRIREQEIASMSSGTTFQAITSKDVRQLPIAFPPIELQQRFAEIVSQLEAQREQQVHSRQRLSALFETLLARAFRGELTAGLTLQEAFGLTERQMMLLRLLNGAGQIQEPVLVTSAMKYAFLFQMEGTRAGQPVERIAAEPRAPYVTEPAYDFVPYKYGPFAKELYDDLEALEASGLVKVEHPPKRKGMLREKTKIYLVQDQADTVHDLADGLPANVCQAVDAVIEEYASLNQKQLLDLVYRQYSEYTVNNKWKRGPFTKANE